MMRESTIAKWKPVIDGYDKSAGTIEEYCERLGISSKKFFYYRKCLNTVNDEEMDISLLPVAIVETKGQTNTTLQINGVPVTYEASSISDHELSRIIRLCRDL